MPSSTSESEEDFLACWPIDVAAAEEKGAAAALSARVPAGNGVSRAQLLARTSKGSTSDDHGRGATQICGVRPLSDFALPALEAAATVCIPVSVAVSLSDGQPQKHNLRSGTRV